MAAAVAILGMCLLATAAGRTRLAGLRKDAQRLAFSVAAVSTAGSFWFSEVGGFVPCEFASTCTSLTIETVLVSNTIHMAFHLVLVHHPVITKFT